MREYLVYKNHNGETIEIGNGPIYANENDLRNFEWEIVERNNRISRFKRGIVKKTIPLFIYAKNESEGIKARNDLYKIAEKDISEKEYGKLYIGDYFLSCYVTKSSKSGYIADKKYMDASIEISTDRAYWIKVEHNNFNATNSEEYASDSGLDYSYDYPYDYASGAVNKLIYNNNYAPCDFEMTIFGSCSNPVVSIGNLAYEVEADIAVGEYLKINTLEKKIYKVKVDGERVNLFHYRSRERSNFFEKIPPGKHAVLWNGSYTFDIDLFYERSEPVWI